MQKSDSIPPRTVLSTFAKNYPNVRKEVRINIGLTSRVQSDEPVGGGEEEGLLSISEINSAELIREKPPGEGADAKKHGARGAWQQALKAVTPDARSTPPSTASKNWQQALKSVTADAKKHKPASKEIYQQAVKAVNAFNAEFSGSEAERKQAVDKLSKGLTPTQKAKLRQRAKGIPAGIKKTIDILSTTNSNLKYRKGSLWIGGKTINGKFTPHHFTPEELDSKCKKK